MNKLKLKLFALKVELNSAFGVREINEFLHKELYNELVDTKSKFFKIQKRVLKIKRLYEL
jgi:hypothetical protein